MNTTLGKIIHRWLMLMDIRVNAAYIQHRLWSHPDYPSALCITSLLTELGIENAVIELDISQLLEVSDPFIAVVDGSSFILIDDIKQAEKLCKNFSQRWSGVIIMAEKPVQIIQTANMIDFELEQSRLFSKKMIVLFLLSSIVLFALSNIAQLSDLIFFFLTLTGLIISGGMVLNELGIQNPVFNAICNVSKKSSCEEISSSNVAKLLADIKLSDLSLSFFLGSFTLSVINSMSSFPLQQNITLLLAWSTMATIPFVFLSVYYQGAVLKKWCTSCLLIATCLVLMVGFQFVNYPHEAIFHLPSFIFSSLSLILPGATWLLLRQIFNKKKEVQQSEVQLLQLFRSAEVFDTYLKIQKHIDTFPLPTDFQIGNRHAPLQVIIISSPYCQPCSDAHLMMMQVIEKHRDKMGITIRFLINPNDDEDMNTPVLEHMLTYALSTEGFFYNPSRIEKMLSDWYLLRDLRLFQNKYPVHTEISVQHYLDEHHNWIKHTRAEYTPEFYVNGYRLQRPYKYQDLLALAGELSAFYAEETLMDKAYKYETLV